MGEFAIKKYIGILIIAFIASVIVVVLQMNDRLNQTEYEPTEEELQLMAEARPLIEEFNKIYVATSQEEYETIITNTTTNPENVMTSLQEVYDGAKEKGYKDIAIKFSEEKIEGFSEEDGSFKYTAKATITLTNENGVEESYSHVSEYNLKKMDDGSYKIDLIVTKEVEGERPNE